MSKLLAQSQPDEKTPVLEYAPSPPPLVPMYRKIMAGALVFAGITLALSAVFTHNEAGLEAFVLVVWGLVVRFQRVRKSGR